MIDDVRTPEPSSISWLLHSAFPITWDDESQSAHMTGSKGQLDAYVVSDHAWSASVSDQFVPPPELPRANPQWHLTLTGLEKATDHRVVAILVPNRAGESNDVQLLQARVVEEGDTLFVHLAYRSDGEEIHKAVELKLAKGAANPVQIYPEIVE